MLSLGAFSQEATQGILNVPSGLRFMPAEHERHAAQEAPFVTRHALVGPGDSCKIFRQVKDPFHHPYLRADEAVFGLIPSWACDSRSASQNCAVHVAAIANKPVYRSSFLHAQFCWLSVSFFLGSVWKEGREQLVRVEREDQQSFYLAGIWSEWALASGSTVLSFCLLMRDCDMQLKAQRLRVGKNATQCYAVLSTETVAGWVDQPPKKRLKRSRALLFPNFVFFHIFNLTRPAMSVDHLAVIKQSNSILAGLSEGDWMRWRHFLTPVELEIHHVIHESGRPEKYIYLPATCIISVQYDFEDGFSAEFAEIGNEGMTGTFIFTGNSSTVSHSTVISKGLAYKADCRFVEHEFNHSSAFRRQILRYMQLLMLYTAQTAVCNRRHSITQQLARVLLVNQDRVAGNDLVFTHELIARSLGVRREGVSQAAKYLQERGDINYSRGNIFVKNRQGLLDSACECYRIVKNETDRLSYSDQHLCGSL